MLAMDRIESERQFHDQQAEQRARYFSERISELAFDDDAYLDHETWIRPAIAELGELNGAKVLDYGCGHGMAAVVLARRGAQVTGVDLSPGYVDEAQRRALANGVSIHFQTANAENLPFDHQSFDAIWGCAILHHLDLERAGQELRRVLRPTGVAVFCEPWGGNPLLNLVRRHVPYPGKERTADEWPLCASDIHVLRRHFEKIEVRGHQFLGMIRRFLSRPRRRDDRLDRWDASLLRRFPILEKWCRYVVLTLRP